MSKVLSKRFVSLLVTLFGLTVVVFSIVHLLPGDPAQVMLGERATPSAVIQLREEMGLDRPLLLQYGSYLGKLLKGDLGRSLQTRQEISTIISEKFPATLELTAVALFFSILVGMSAGVFAASRRNSFFDSAVMIGALTGISMPIFWLALILLYVFGFQLNLFPITGRLPADLTFKPITYFILFDSLISGRLDVFCKALHHLILPALALSTIPMAIIARITRAAVIETLGEDFIRTARAKGLTEKVIVLKHALTTALIPILTVIGLQFGLLLGGAIITETIFAWPGMGTWLLSAVNSRDYPAVQGGVLAVGLAFSLVNLAVDLLYSAVDPRIRK